MITKFSIAMLGLFLIAASCTSSQDDQTNSGTNAPTSTTTTAPNEVRATIPEELDPATLEAAPSSDAPAGAFCERYQPNDSRYGAFSGQPCDDTPTLDIIAVTTLCPSGNCLDGFEIVVETAEPFSISADDLMPAENIHAIDISLTGTIGEIRCTVRNSLGTRQVGCLDTNQALKSPPAEVWTASDDGTRHRFGTGSEILGDVVAISILISEVSDGPQGAVGTFNVVNPVFPGRHVASASGAAEVARDLIADDLAGIGADSPESAMCVTSELETRLTTAEITTAIVHGAVDYSDQFVSAAAESFEVCKPILEVYRADFERSPLTPECVDLMSEAITAEFGWQGILETVRSVAIGDLTKSERDGAIESFTLQKYVEFDCVAVE